MKVTNTQRVYCIEITVKQMRKILRYDKAAEERAYRTSMRNNTREGFSRKLNCLLDIFGVSNIEYDGMFGPCIWVTIDEPNFEETLEKVKQVVAQCVR